MSLHHHITANIQKHNKVGISTSLNGRDSRFRPTLICIFRPGPSSMCTGIRYDTLVL